MPRRTPAGRKLLLGAACVFAQTNICVSGQIADSPVLAGSPGAVCAGAPRPQPIELADAVGWSLEHQPQLIIARGDAEEARSDRTAAAAAFVPSVQFSVTDERYVPNNPNSPVVVVGNTVLGGAQTKSAYGSLSVSWNLMNSGRDVAAYRGTLAAIRAADAGVGNQLLDTLSGVLQAYADLYEAGVAARNEAGSVRGLREIYLRAEERYQHGHGTTVAIGQARNAALDAEQSLNRACRTMADKSAALAQATGLRVSPEVGLAVSGPLPLPFIDPLASAQVEEVVEATPAVTAAKEKLAAAEAKLQQSLRAFGPSLSLSVRRDYLGQSVDSFGAANHHIGPNDYRVGLSFEQPLFPMLSESAAVSRSRAEVRKAQAGYEQARIEAETKLRGALSAQREADASYMAAKVSFAESERVLSLTESQLHAGRTDLDSVEHARMDRDKAEADLRTLASRRAIAEWLVARAVQPGDFPDLLFRQLHLSVRGERWRDQQDDDPLRMEPQ